MLASRIYLEQNTVVEQVIFLNNLIVALLFIILDK